MEKIKEYKEFIIILVFAIGGTIGALDTFVTKEAHAAFQQEVRCDRLEDKVDRIQDWILDLHIKYDGDIKHCSATEKAAHVSKTMKLDRLNQKLDSCGGS